MSETYPEQPATQPEDDNPDQLAGDPVKGDLDDDQADETGSDDRA